MRWRCVALTLLPACGRVGVDSATDEIAGCTALMSDERTSLGVK